MVYAQDIRNTYRLSKVVIPFRGFEKCMSTETLIVLKRKQKPFGFVIFLNDYTPLIQQVDDSFVAEIRSS